MPFGWGRSKSPDPAPAISSAPLPSSASDAPLSDGMQFLVEAVYTITGIGCIVVGSLERGQLDVPAQVRIVDGTTGQLLAAGVEVVGAEAHRQSVQHLGPGEKVGLRLRGVPSGSALKGRWAVAKGDRLVAP